MILRLALCAALALSVATTRAQAQREAPPVAVHVSLASDQRLAPPLVHVNGAMKAAEGQFPSWLRWGLVGAAAGAVTFPLLGSMASDSRHEPARDAVVGAAAGFVIVGGGVALWQSLCGPDSPSRRAGMCGR